MRVVWTLAALLGLGCLVVFAAEILDVTVGTVVFVPIVVLALWAWFEICRALKHEERRR